MVDSLLTDRVVLRCRRCTEYLGTDALGDLRRRDAYAAGRGVNQHPLPRLEPSHHDKPRLGGRVVHGERRALLEGKLLGQLVDHVLGYGHQFRVSVEARTREDPLTRRDRIDPGPYRLDFTRDLVADHARDLRRVRVEPGPRHRVGKVDPCRLHRDPHLTGPYRRVRSLLDLQNLGASEPGDHNRPHRRDDSTRI